MTSRDFCYWLQGFFELAQEAEMDLAPDTVKLIRKHLDMVFIHEIDPSFPKTQQNALNLIHKTKHDPNTKARC